MRLALAPVNQTAEQLVFVLNYMINVPIELLKIYILASPELGRQKKVLYSIKSKRCHHAVAMSL